VNARLLEIIRKTRVEQEVEIKGKVVVKAVVRRGSSAKEDMPEKTIQKIEEKERELTVAPTLRSKRAPYSHGYIRSLSHHPLLQLKLLNSLNYTAPLPRSVSAARSRVIPSCSWSPKCTLHQIIPYWNPLYPQHHRYNHALNIGGDPTIGLTGLSWMRRGEWVQRGLD